MGVVGLVAIARASGIFGRGDAIDVPTTPVIRGEFIDYLQVRGEVKAVRSVPLTAPSSAGDLQILALTKNGESVKKGDVVVRFDPVPVERTHAEKLSELKQAEEEIGKTEAQYRIQEQQSETDLVKARYDVQRAELDAVDHKFLAALDVEQRKLALASAREKPERWFEREVGHGPGVTPRKRSSGDWVFVAAINLQACLSRPARPHCTIVRARWTTAIASV